MSEVNDPWGGGLEMLFERLELATQSARRGTRGIAVLAVAVHERGNPSPLPESMWDAVQQQAIARIRRVVRRIDTVVILRPAEFLVLLERPEEGSFAVHAADEVVTALRTRYLVDGQHHSLVASVGISAYPGDGDDVDILIRCADSALEAAKAAGGDIFGFYSGKMNEAATRRIEIERGLTEAISRNEFHLCYQPQIDTADGSLVGVEALLRWRSPKLGMVSPGEFIPILESTGGIRKVGDWVLNEACQRAAGWHREGRPIKVGVNVSAQQLTEDDFARTVDRALEKSGLPPNLLELELTESVLVGNVGATKATLEGLRKRGIRVAVDDFGTGYASLAYVRQFPMDTLKIDRQFVRGLPVDAENAAISAAIIALGRSLRLRVVAEGVENEAEEEFLHSLSCTIVQGFLHARPMTAEQLAEWRKKRPWA